MPIKSSSAPLVFVVLLSAACSQQPTFIDKDPINHSDQTTTLPMPLPTNPYGDADYDVLIERLLHHRDPSVRMNAAKRLGEKSDAKYLLNIDQVAQALIQAIEFDSAVLVQKNSITSLGNILYLILPLPNSNLNTKNSPLELLESILDDASTNVILRAESAKALVQATNKHISYTQKILRLISPKDITLSAGLALALQSIGSTLSDADFDSLLEHLANEQFGPARVAITAAISTSTEKSYQALPILLSMIEDLEHQNKEDGLSSLGALPQKILQDVQVAARIEEVLCLYSKSKFANLSLASLLSMLKLNLARETTIKTALEVILHSRDVYSRITAFDVLKRGLNAVMRPLSPTEVDALMDRLQDVHELGTIKSAIVSLFSALKIRPADFFETFRSQLLLSHLTYEYKKTLLEKAPTLINPSQELLSFSMDLVDSLKEPVLQVLAVRLIGHHKTFTEAKDFLLEISESHPNPMVRNAAMEEFLKLLD